MCERDWWRAPILSEQNTTKIGPSTHERCSGFPGLNGAQRLTDLVLYLPPVTSCSEGERSFKSGYWAETPNHSHTVPLRAANICQAQKERRWREGWSTIPAEVSGHTVSVHFLRRDEEHFYLEEINTAITKNTKRHISISLDDTSYCVKETSQ